MRLDWLPLAVRHKLDEEGLRLTLAQWQALTTTARADLLARMPQAGFARAARAAGARLDSPARTRQEEIDGAELARCFGLDPYDAHEWLSKASPFARFVAAKRIGRANPETHLTRSFT